jgi:hypothetical protein
MRIEATQVLQQTGHANYSSLRSSGLARVSFPTATPHETQARLRLCPGPARRQHRRCRLELLEHHRLEMLELGAVARLLVSGELQAVVPLDDAAQLDAASPLRPGGLDPVALAKREEAMAIRALAAGPVSVLVCGGSHDLTAAFKRQSVECEYLRVTTNG